LKYRSLLAVISSKVAEPRDGAEPVPRLEVEHEASSRGRVSLARLTFSNDLVEAASGEGSSCATP
jgi:hypothetical protein